MEDARRQHGVGAACGHALGQMLERADTATGDHRDAHRVGDRTREREIETALGAVAVHAGEQDLARTERRDLARPLDGVESGVVAPAVSEDLPLAGRGLLGVDRHHDALAADLARGVMDQLRVVDRRGVHADLVGTGVEQPAHVLDHAHAAADGKRDEHLFSHLFDHVQDDVAIVGAGGDVEEGDLVCTLLVVAAGDLHRVAGIAQLDEIDALDHAPGLHVQAGDDALGQHQQRSLEKIIRSHRSVRPRAPGRR